MSDCNCNSPTTVKPATICPAPPLQNVPYNTPYTQGEEIALRNNWIANQANTEFDTKQLTTNPLVPYNTGVDVSEMRSNTAANKIFTTINQRKQAGTLFGTGCPVFRTQQEKIQYIQAQYAQPTGFPGSGDRVKLGINTLFA